MTKNQILYVISDAVMESKYDNASKLAEASGVHCNTIWRLLRGEETRVSTLIQICDALGLEVIVQPKEEE